MLDFRLRELIRYRDLIYLFIKRDFSTLYMQTILGPLWFVLNPLFSTIVYTFVFGRLAHIGTDGIPHILFYYSGTMLWTYFSNCFNDASNVFINNAHIFGKVYFPRLTVPVSKVFSNLITALVQFGTLLCFYIWFYFHGVVARPQVWAFAFLLIFAWLAVISSGIGLLVTAITTKYRDLKQLVTFGLQLLMYGTPVVYPLSAAPEKFKWIFYINPLSAPVELFRVWFFGAGTVPPKMIVISLATTLVFFFLGIIMFNRNERTFIDVI
jgi:lipopolysaccharide transport system permease protein